MIRYPLPAELTREEFYLLASSLYSRLQAGGINPAQNLAIEDREEALGGNVVCQRLEIFISEAAAQLLQTPII